MKQYHDLLKKVLKEGVLQQNRTGVKAYSILGEMLSFDMKDGFPAITTKKLAFNSVKGELLGFLRGYTNAKDFRDLGCNVWNQNANENQAWLNNPVRKGEDDLGVIYGSQWINYNGDGVNQIKNLLDEINHNPASRRLRVTAWNPLKLDQMALPPCHTDFQVYINTSTQEMSMTMNQRSCDLFLGIPFNIASYALLLHIIAEATGYTPRHLKMFLGDVHIYENHVDQVKEQLIREEYDLPKIVLNKWNKDFDISAYAWIQSIEPDDILLEHYYSHPAIKAPMAV